MRGGRARGHTRKPTRLQTPGSARLRVAPHSRGLTEKRTRLQPLGQTRLRVGLHTRRRFCGRVAVLFCLLWWLASVVLLPASAKLSSAAAPSEGAGGLVGQSGGGERDYLAELGEAVPEEYRAVLDERGASELVGAEYLFSYLLSGLKNESGAALRLFAALFGMVLLGRVITEMGEGEKPLSRVSGILIGSVCALSFFAAVSGSVHRVGVYLGDLKTFLNGSTPILTALLVAGGSTAAGGSAAASFSLGLVLLENLLTGVLYPLTGVCFAMGLLDTVSPDLRLGGVSKHLKWLYMTLLGVASAVSTAALSFQTTLASSADSVAMRSAKYAVGSMIPIVGGSIGAALGTLGSSLSLVKNTAGVSCVAVVLLLTLPELIYLFLARLAVSAAGTAAEALGFTVGEKLLGSFLKIYDMLLATVAAAGVTWILYFSVVLKVAYPTGA